MRSHKNIIICSVCEFVNVRVSAGVLKCVKL